MKIIPGTLKADAGEVVVAGSPLANAEPHEAAGSASGSCQRSWPRTPT
jgi:hypothetical protein